MHILSIILPVFGVIGAGWLTRRHNILKAQAADTFNRFVYLIALPFLVLQGTLGLKREWLLDWRLLATNLLALGVLTGIAAVATKFLHLNQKKAAMFIVASYFGSTAYVGIPFNTLAFGLQGTALASFISVLVVVFSVVVGLSTLQAVTTKRGFRFIDALKQISKMPIIWAAALGLILALSGATVPSGVFNFIALLANIAGPLALFSLGMFVFENPFDDGWLFISLLALFNLLVLPLVVFLFGRAFGLTGLPFQVSIIQAGMPIAVTNFVFSHQFHIEEKHISQAIVLSVLLAPLTLSLLLWLVQGL